MGGRRELAGLIACRAASGLLPWQRYGYRSLCPFDIVRSLEALWFVAVWWPVFPRIVTGVPFFQNLPINFWNVTWEILNEFFGVPRTTAKKKTLRSGARLPQRWRKIMDSAHNFVDLRHDGISHNVGYPIMAVLPLPLLNLCSASRYIHEGYKSHQES